MNRFDNALKKLDASANSRTGDRRAEFNGSEAKYLAAVLRAGRELRGVVLRYDDQCRDHAASNYDNAINAGGNDAEG